MHFTTTYGFDSFELTPRGYSLAYSDRSSFTYNGPSLSAFNDAAKWNYMGNMVGSIANMGAASILSNSFSPMFGGNIFGGYGGFGSLGGYTGFGGFGGFGGLTGFGGCSSFGSLGAFSSLGCCSGFGNYGYGGFGGGNFLSMTLANSYTPSYSSYYSGGFGNYTMPAYSNFSNMTGGMNFGGSCYSSLLGMTSFAPVPISSVPVDNTKTETKTNTDTSSTNTSTDTTSTTTNTSTSTTGDIYNNATGSTKAEKVQSIVGAPPSKGISGNWTSNPTKYKDRRHVEYKRGNFDLDYWKKQGYDAESGAKLAVSSQNKYSGVADGNCVGYTRDSLNEVYGTKFKTTGAGQNLGKDLLTAPALYGKFRKVSLSEVKSHGLPDGAIVLYEGKIYKDPIARKYGHGGIAYQGAVYSNVKTKVDNSFEIWIPIYDANSRVS